MKSLILLTFLFSTIHVFSQKPTLSKSTYENFNPIVGGTTLSTVSNSDDDFDELDLSTFNFSFVFNNTLYSKIYVCSNGFISLNNNLTDYENQLSNTNGNQTDIIAPWWDDLYSIKGQVSDATSKYKINGVAPNRELIIEWNMFKHFANTDLDDQKVTFQVTIFENSKKMKFNYKRNQFTNNTIMSASIGFKFIDDSYLAFNHDINTNILNANATLVDNIDQADFSDYQDNLALYFGFDNPYFKKSNGPITLCKNGSYFLDPSTTNGTWVSTNPNVATVSLSGYITALSTDGLTDISLTTDIGTVSATVTVGSTSSITITDPTAQPNYKFDNNPHGPQDGTINYVGYNGFTYSSQTQPTNTGYYRASKQVGNEAGCPVPFYIIKCDSCH